MLSESVIMKLAGGLTVYQRAHEYARLGKVKIVAVNEWADEIVVNATVQGEQKYDVELTYNTDKDLLSDSYCNCPAFYRSETPCKHICAVLFCLMNDANSEYRNDKTDSFVQKLFSQYEMTSLKQLEIETYADESKVHFSPVLDLSFSNYPQLRLKMGVTRMYYIKDLMVFYSNMKAHTRVSYGQQLTWTHTLSGIEANDKPLVRFVMNCCNNIEERATHGSYYYTRNPAYITLTSVNLDEFIAIMHGQNIFLKLPDDTEHICSVVDGEVKLPMNITRNKLGGINITFSFPPFCVGENKIYTYDRKQNAMVCSSQECKSALMPLFSMMRSYDNSGKINCQIASEDVSRFFFTVYSEIEKYVELTGDTDIADSFVPNSCEYRLYLDAPDRNTISGNLMFRYGNDEIRAYGNMKNIPRRDMKKETRLKYITQKSFSELKDETLYFTGSDDDFFTFISEKIPALMQLGSVFISDRLKKFETTAVPKISAAISLDANLLDVSFNVENFPINELANVLDAYKQKQHFYRLKNGEFLSLRDNSISDLAEIVAGTQISSDDLLAGHVQLPQYNAFYIDSLLNEHKTIRFDRSDAFRNMIRNMKNVEDSHYKITKPLNTILRNYQKIGYRWLRTLTDFGFGGILADDMGLGKTIQIIALLSATKQEQGKLSALIVCPSSLVLNWKSEFKKFEPTLSVVSLLGNQDSRHSILDDFSSYDVLITSYDQIKRDIPHYSNLNFDFEILDEAQIIKNAYTKGAKAVKSVNAAHRFALTGTPIENRLSELWSIFDFLMKGYLFEYARFREFFELPIVKQNDEAALNRVKRLTAPFVLRRMKSDVLKELPAKTECTRMIPLSGEQKKLYYANLLIARNQVNKEISESKLASHKIEILALLMRLRQICCDPRLYLEDYKSESAKLDLCTEIVQEAIDSGHKILIFSQFTSMLDLIRERLTKCGYSSYTLQGSTSKAERQRLVENFNIDPTNVFLISLRAGGLGLNLTGADVVIHYDPWWNTAAQNQATDRAYRIGQTKCVQVFKLITQNTIEQRIMDLQAKKQALADSIITEGNALASMNENDWKELFS